MRAGAPDKVVYEAAAACLPVLASNPIFDELLAPEQRFTRWDPGALADRIRALAALSRRREPRSGTRFASASPRATRCSRGRVASSTRQGSHDRRRRPPHPEGRGHLRLGGAPPAAPARSARARLGRALPHAPRGRARRVGVRRRAARARRPARRHPPARRRRSRSRSARSPPTSRACAPASSTRTSCTPTSTGSSPAR